MKTCVTCGVDLTGKRRLYCSKTCSRGLVSSQHPTQCAGCGGTLPPKKHQGAPRKWCSETCRVRTHRYGAGVLVKVCIHCETKFTANSQRQTLCSPACTKARAKARGAENRGPLVVVVARACEQCGRVWIPRPNNYRARFCSQNCGAVQHARLRRARQAGAFVEVVVPAEVYARDDWICQLCQLPIDPSLPPRSLMAATVDHIVALARGGEHSMTNVQSAHLRCNAKKWANAA